MVPADDIPVLFEVSCFNNGIQIGGYPWHYIFTPNNKRHQGTHHICSLKDGSLVTDITVWLDLLFWGSQKSFQNFNCDISMLIEVGLFFWAESPSRCLWQPTAFACQ